MPENQLTSSSSQLKPQWVILGIFSYTGIWILLSAILEDSLRGGGIVFMILAGLLGSKLLWKRQRGVAIGLLAGTIGMVGVSILFILLVLLSGDLV